MAEEEGLGWRGWALALGGGLLWAMWRARDQDRKEHERLEKAERAAAMDELRAAAYEALAEAYPEATRAEIDRMMKTPEMRARVARELGR